MTREYGIALALLAAPTAPLQAEPHQFGSNCAYIAVIAELIMELRQMGSPMLEAMERHEEGSIERVIVQDAYRRNRYSTLEVQHRETEDFRDVWTLRCYDAAR